MVESLMAELGLMAVIREEAQEAVLSVRAKCVGFLAIF